MRKSGKDTITGVAIQIVPVVIMLASILLVGWNLRGATFEDIVNYAPDNKVLAALVIWGFFTLKSLSVLIPLVVIYMGTGIIFSTPVAIAVNLVGMFLCVSIPYCIGRFSCGGLADKILQKYAAAKKISLWTGRNHALSAYILRVISILPGDVVSLFLGASKMKFWPYVLGSVLGLCPVMIITTLLGSKLSDPLSPEFIGLLILLIIVTLGSTLIFNHRSKQKEQ